MKRFSLASLEKMAAQRPASYLADVLSRSSVADGIAEITDEAYSELVAKYRKPAPPARSMSRGPGTELSKLLKRFGINPTPTCQCRAKAREMDDWGPDECEKPERIEEVLGVMREEAKARGLPFIDAAGRMLIRRAIANARRAAS